MSKLFLFVFLCFTFNANAQDLAASKNTFLSVSFTISSTIAGKLDPKKAVLNSAKESQRTNQAYLKALLQEFAVTTLYDELSTQHNITLEKKEALRDYTLFSEGLPLVLIPKSAIKKILKKGYETDFFHTIVLSVTEDIFGSASFEVIPEIKSTIKIFDNKRAVVKKIVQESKVENPIKKRDFEHGFSKFSDVDMEELAEKLKPIIKENIVMAVKQF